jgi:hypothetical protein
VLATPWEARLADREEIFLLHLACCVGVKARFPRANTKRRSDPPVEAVHDEGDSIHRVGKRSDPWRECYFLALAGPERIDT